MGALERFLNREAHACHRPRESSLKERFLSSVPEGRYRKAREPREEIARFNLPMHPDHPKSPNTGGIIKPGV
jgi:hypothetical protein